MLYRIAGRAVIATCGIVGGFSFAENYNHNKGKIAQYDAEEEGEEKLDIPARSALLQKLKSGEVFDLLIIGGGATGAGAALDAASRGLKVACVEREDFSSGTSSRSTKLIWAGSRYLVNACVSLFNSDLRLLREPIKTIEKFLGEVRMVQNCHRERRFLLETQPHLTYWTPIAVPFSKLIMWPPPFGFAPAALGPLGLFPAFFKVYDAMGGFCSPPSHIMSSKRADRKYPMLNKNIIYSSIFYEGMHDDARTNLAIALTASRYGAAMANYCNVVSFITAGQELDRERSERSVRSSSWFRSSAPDSPSEPALSNPHLVVGAVVRDELSGEEFSIRAKRVVMCGGPFAIKIPRSAS